MLRSCFALDELVDRASIYPCVQNLFLFLRSTVGMFTIRLLSLSWSLHSTRISSISTTSSTSATRGLKDL